jgi:hypothetical protein
MDTGAVPPLGGGHRSQYRGAGAILARRPHPEQGFRTCLGVLRLFKDLNQTRAEAVAARSIACEAFTYKSIASIIASKLDRATTAASEPQAVLTQGNLRGSKYFH